MKSRTTLTCSVCIPAYNNSDAFTRCLASVLRQIGPELECVVSDDSTTDAIRNCVEAQKDDRVRYVRNTPSLGAPANWNAALARAQGDIVTLLHQDDWYRSDQVLAEVLGAMEKSRADVIVTGRALYEGCHCLGEYINVRAALSRFLKDYPSRSLVVNRLGHPSVFFFRKELAQVRYDENLLYFSDTEYYQRLLSVAGQYDCVNKPLVALERGTAGQLSAACLNRPEALVDELLYALNKHAAGDVAQGVAGGRLLASNLRLLPTGRLWRMIRRVFAKVSPSSGLVLILSLPFFCLHMLYRLAFRRVAGKPWG